jgi:flagellar biosynthesis/type III secretory pathway protein FliH
MNPIRLQLSIPVDSVKMVDPKEAQEAAQKKAMTDSLQQQLERVNALCAALQKAVAQVEQISKDIFVSHREQIVRLSIEIAAKILAKDIHERHYDMETIVLQALQSIPSAQRVTVRLNPDDLAAWQDAVNNKQAGDPENICCIGDWSVGHAECIVETDQGVIEYLIQEQIKQVTAALLGSETPVESSR